jgi:flagellar hook-associated protein 3 FlgL
VQTTFSGTPADGDSFDVSTAKNAGTDIFAAIGELVSALRTPLTGGGAAAQAKLQNALSTANVKVTNAHDNVLTVLSSVGSRQTEIDALDTAGAASKLQEESYRPASRTWTRTARSRSSTSASRRCRQRR